MDNVPIRTTNVHVEQHGPRGSKGKQKKNRIKSVLVTIIIFVIFAVTAFFALSIYRSSTSTAIDSSKYQAVFFTNGQVYFGKLQTMSGNYMRLTDIFYLQAKSDATDPSQNPQATSTESTTDVQLIKLGDEIHGPEDEMIISNDQVLFFENLKSDGKVSQSIVTYKQQ